MQVNNFFYVDHYNTALKKNQECARFFCNSSAHASSIPPPCGSISLYGVRHMEKKAGTTFCKPACKLVPAFFSACAD